MNNNYQTLLKRIYNSQKINVFPQTLAKLVFLSQFDHNTNANDVETIIGGENGIWSRIQWLEQEIDHARHFRGAYDSMDEIKKIKRPRPGDYAIWKRVNEDDMFVIFDIASEEKPDGTYDGNWREVGKVYQSAVTSVNGEVGDVILNGDNIESSYDSSGNTKVISSIFKDLTSYVNEHETKINSLIEDTIELQTFVNELETTINLIESNKLEFKGNWVQGTTYKKNDIVKQDKNLYISQRDEVASNPATNISNGDWAIFVEGFSGDFNELVNVPDLVTQEELNEAISSIPTPDVSGQISEHNLNEESHPFLIEKINEVKNLLPTVTILEE